RPHRGDPRGQPAGAAGGQRRGDGARAGCRGAGRVRRGVVPDSEGPRSEHGAAVSGLVPPGDPAGMGAAAPAHGPRVAANSLANMAGRAASLLFWVLLTP